MESVGQVALAVLATAVVIGAIGALRRVTAAPDAPEWLVSDAMANALALTFTLASAATLFYVGYSLSNLIPTSIAVLASFGIYFGLWVAVLQLTGRASTMVDARPEPSAAQTRTAAA